MKFAALALVVLLGAGALLAPVSDEPSPGDVPGREVPPISICPLVEGGERSTSVAVLSSINGEGRISSFAAGAETGALDFRTGATGSIVVPAEEIGAVGDSGGLIELPSETTGSGVIIAGEASLATESCADTPTVQSFIAGGSTASGASFVIQLLNPYAGEAIVDVTVSTEAGLESDERFDSVVVPALSTRTLDLAELIPGRETITVELETVRGSILAVGRQTTDGEVAVWRAVEPAQDWWLPVPSGGAVKQLVIGTPGSEDVEFQIDSYGPDGFTEALQSGTVPGRGQMRVDLAAISEQAMGLRVITSAPVVPALWIDSAAGLAATTASPVDAAVWFLPGAQGPAGGSGEIVVLNSGLDDVTVTLRSLREQSVTRDFQLPAEGVLVTDLATAADGYRVEATGPVVALWTSQIGGAGAVALGIPIQDE
jgi:hypothetical protein